MIKQNLEAFTYNTIVMVPISSPGHLKELGAVGKSLYNGSVKVYEVEIITFLNPYGSFGWPIMHAELALDHR